MQFEIADGDAKNIKTLIVKVAAQGGPYTLGRIPLGATIERVTVGVRTGFNGSGAAINVGISGTTNKYMATAKITEDTAGVYQYLPGVTTTAAETAIVTLTDPDGTTGDATVILEYRPA